MDWKDGEGCACMGDIIIEEKAADVSIVSEGKKGLSE